MKIFTSMREREAEATGRARDVAGLPPVEPDLGVPVAPSSRSERWGMLHRSGANFVTVGIGAIAGYISWLHLYALGTSQPLTPGLSIEQEHTVAALTPFSIDGLILAGTLKLREARLADRPAHWAAYLAVLLGVGLTLAGNIASAPDALWARVLAAAPPAAFLISVEVLAGKPLTRNLWEILRELWHRGQRHLADQAKEPEEAPEPDVPVKASQGHAEPLTPQTPPALPTPPAAPARRKTAGRAAVVRSGQKVTGSRTRPARMVGGRVLEGEDLRADARRRITVALAEGKKREGLGAWVARQYDPEMSERWGAERVAEVGDFPDPQELEELAGAEPALEIDGSQGAPESVRA